MTGVFPKPAKDKDGLVDPALQPTQISVHAKFNDADGFFGLTSYLTYAQKQIAYSRDCVEKANAGVLNKLQFPWSEIDDSEVEAVGFIPHPFEFTIDQTRILDLLTGHTLYNESTVAIRELVQNSLDAIRVYEYDRNKLDVGYTGSVKVRWDSESLELSVLDNGTGMTQDIIERHLLKVGSSRYQDPAFKEDYKNFSPISRFGIGVLSAFMVADDVRIVTFHKDEAEGREISLRSVHGKYLIRLLDKEKSDEVAEIGPHGTKIILKFRSSAKRVNVVRTLQRWIVFPECSVTISMDRGEPIQIGFKQPKDALKHFIESNPELGISGPSVNYFQNEVDGITIAYATTYNRHFRDSSFVQYSDNMRRLRNISPTGVCIEGVRVEFDPPGISGRGGLLSVANCKGKSAPKTNVARTSLESESDKSRVAKIALELYMKQVQAEIERMQTKESYSLSYAIEQFPFIAGQVFSAGSLSDDEIRFNAAWKFPMYILETDQRREAVSGEHLHTIGGFWTVESQSVSSLIALLRDSPPSVTCRQVSEVSHFKGEPLPNGGFIVNSYLGKVASEVMRARFEIKELRGSVSDRRLDMRWEPIDDERRWLSSDELEAMTSDLERSRSEQARRYGFERNQRNRVLKVNIPLQPINVAGLDDYCAVDLQNEIFMFWDTPVTEFLIGLDLRESHNKLQILIYADLLFSSAVRKTRSGAMDIDYAIKEILARYDTEGWNIAGFVTAVKQTEPRLKTFNPWSWRRQESAPGRNEWEDPDF